MNIYECELQEACRGGSDTHSYCKDRYHGVLCNSCEKNYYRNEEGCEKCDEFKWLAPIVVTSAIIVVLILLFACYRSKGARSKTSRLLKSRIKQIFVTTQIIVSMNTVYDYENYFPSGFVDFLDILSYIVLEFSVAVGTECYIRNLSPFYVELLMSTAVPLVVIVVLLLLPKLKFALQKGAVSRANTAAAASATTAAAQRLYDNCFSVVVLIVYCLLPTSSKIIFDTFDCTSFSEGGLHDDKQLRRLRSDLGVDCDKRSHQMWEIYAGVMILCWPVGMQLSLFLVLYRYRRELQGKVPVQESDDSEQDSHQGIDAGNSHDETEEDGKSDADDSHIRNSADGSHIRKSSTNHASGEEGDDMKETEPQDRIQESRVFWEGIAQRAKVPSNDNDLTSAKTYRGIVTSIYSERLRIRDNDTSIDHIRLITDMYRLGCPYWEGITTTYRILLSSAATLLSSDSILQLILGLFVIFSTALLQSVYAPYRDSSENRFAIFSFGIMFTIYVVGMVAKIDDKQYNGSDGEVMAAFLTGLVIFVVLGGIVMVAGQAFFIVKRFEKKAMRLIDRELLNTECEVVKNPIRKSAA